METHFMVPTAEQWVYGVEVLPKIVHQYPQAAYHESATLLQSEWQYISRTVPGLEDHM